MTQLPKLLPRSVDMSPEAIDQRLRDVSELNYLCMTLASAKRLGTVKEVRAREQAERDAIVRPKPESSSILRTSTDGEDCDPSSQPRSSAECTE